MAGEPDTKTSDGLLGDLVARARPGEPLRLAVAHPCDADTLSGLLDARDAGLVAPVLVGPPAKIEATALTLGRALDGMAIEPAPHSHAAAEIAVALARQGRVKAVMKGSLHTDELMHAILDRAAGLRTDRRLSHVYVLEVPSYPKPLFVTDAAVNIAPTLAEKADIARNAIALARGLGVARPKLAVLSAVETVDPAIQSTIDAAALATMARRGQIEGGLVDGPLAFDNAIDAQAARAKGIVSEVAGDADILLVPDLVSGNILAKQLVYLAGATAAGVVMGARVPIVLTSRADSPATRLASIAVAKILVRDAGGEAR
jgi:phosphate acetyltransferase